MEAQVKHVHKDNIYIFIVYAQAKIGKSWSLKQVRRKDDLCAEVLEVMNRIDPGRVSMCSLCVYALSQALVIPRAR
jgi:hypothetical protein